MGHEAELAARLGGEGGVGITDGMGGSNDDGAILEAAWREIMASSDAHYGEYARLLKSSAIGITIRYLYREFLRTEVLDILAQSRLATPKQEWNQDRFSHESCVRHGHRIGHSSLETHNIHKLLN